MKYTAADIAVLSFAYNGDVLKLDYEVSGGEHTHFFSEVQLMSFFSNESYCRAFSPSEREILVPVPKVGVGNPEYAWVSIDYFVRQNLDRDMAEKIILNHLNIVTA